MSFIDIVILIVVAYAVFRGAYRGAVLQVASLCGVFFGIMAGKAFTQELRNWIVLHTGLPPHIFPTASFGLVFLAVVIICGLIGKSIQRLVRFSGMNAVNRIIGGIFSLSKWLLILSVIFNLVEFLSLNKAETLSKEIKSSCLYEPVKRIVPALFPSISINNMNDATKKLL